MINVGEYNTLVALRSTSVGFFLGDGDEGEVLLPNKYVPEGFDVDQDIEVFIYRDSEDRLIATNLTPLAKKGEFACLRVKEVNDFGAFLDWGLEKDLLVPFKEQKVKMIEGNWHIVYVYLDGETDRIVATAKVDRLLKKISVDVEENDEVDVLISDPSDLGVNVIVNNQYSGLIYESDLFQKVLRGDRLTGYVKKVREDLKLDIVLQKPGYESVEPNAQKILQKLKYNNGFLNLNDKSHPDDIAHVLGMSKKTFKKAIGSLYRERVIRIETDGIYFLND